MNKIIQFLLVGSWLMSSTFMYGAPGFSGGGTGTVGDPYKLATLADLNLLSTNSSFWGAGKYFEQTADIDATATSTLNSGAGFSPIGNATTKFSGSYDGKGFKITNLYINRPTTDYIGLFGYTITGSLINNVKLITCTITGKGYVGAGVGRCEGQITNCSSTGSVSGTMERTGGLIGLVSNTVTNCNSSCTVAVAGSNTGLMSFGGLVGFIQNATVSNSFSAGSVTANSVNAVGGFAGYIYGGTITKCYSSSNTIGTDYVGGFVGSVSESNPVLLNNCYALGSITGNENVGGFAGYVTMYAATSEITSSYSRSVVTGNTFTQGFCGNTMYASKITYCCFDAEMDGLASAPGTKYNGADGKTTAEMKLEDTYPGNDFSYYPIWKIDSNNGGYPYLAWQVFVNPEIDLKQSATAIADGTGTYGFGSKDVSTNTDVIFTIENTGAAVSTLGNFTVTGTNANQFSIQGTAPTTVAAGASATFTVRFTPTSVGAKTATVSFANQDANENPYSFDVTGTGVALSLFSGGAGTVGSPYQITTFADLRFLSENSSYWAAGKYFEQTADIDASATSTSNSNGTGGYYGFSPIGNFTTKFLGSYDGKGFKITNLYINRPTTDYVGLFGFASYSSVINNVKLITCNITGRDNVGAGVGSCVGGITNCSSTGSVSGLGSSIGGLIGYASGNIVSDCNSACTVATLGTGSALTGYGGLIGYIAGADVSNCFSTGSVTANSLKYIGGFVGKMNGSTITNCYSTGNVIGYQTVGGFVGYGSDDLPLFIADCYSMGNVTGTDGVGGFAGTIESWGMSSISFSRCYSRSVVTGTTNTNGFDGFLQNYGTLSLTDCYFDADIDGLASTSSGTSNNGATGKTTAQMKTQATFTNWDFATTPIWKIDTNNDGYPYLASQTFATPAVIVATNSSTSTLSLSGSSDVEVAAGVTLTLDGNATINSLILAPTAKLSLGSNTLNASNGVILQSSVDGTATILGDNAVSNATVQQYVTAGRNWYISSPLSSAGYADLSRGVSVVEWNEATKNWDTKSSGTLIQGKGYIQVADAVQTGSTGTLSFGGTTNAGNIDVAVTRTESGNGPGFNLVGNPYPSYLNWSSFIAEATNANISKTYWYRTKNTIGGYTFVTYNGVGGTYVTSTGTANTAITGKIPPMQGFWIRVNSGTASTTARFTNAMREHRDGDQNIFKAPKADERACLRLQLINGAKSDETMIYFDENAANQYDDYDSPKMMNNSDVDPDLYTKAGNERLVINGLKSVTDNLELALGFNLNAPANLKIKAGELANFKTGTRIYLLDKAEKTQTELYPETEYSFSTKTATTNNENRFSLLFRAPGISTDVDKAGEQAVNVFVDATNQLIVAAPLNSSYAIYNAVGQQIENGILNYKLQTINCKLNSGIYVVKVGNQTTRVIIK